MWLRDSCESWRGDGWAWAWVASVIGSVYLKVLKLIQTLFPFYLKITQADIENANLLLLPFPLEHNWVHKFRCCHFLSSFGSHVWESCTGMYRYIYIWAFINQIIVKDMLATCMSSKPIHRVTFLQVDIQVDTGNHAAFQRLIIMVSEARNSSWLRLVWSIFRPWYTAVEQK